MVQGNAKSIRFNFVTAGNYIHLCTNSSIQIVPNIIKRVKHLHNYIRTPTWVAPRDQAAFPSWMKFIFAYVPFVMLCYRAYLFIIRDLYHKSFSDANSKGALERRSLIEQHMKYVMKSYVREDLVPKLIPNFPVGCKRIAISDDYIQALCSSNCTIHRSPIQKVQGRSITTADGVETEVDTLILATGFDVTGFLGDLQVQGRDGVSLNKLWEDQTAKTYKTVNVHGFPNFFIMLGPGSGLGHNSVVAIVER